MGAAPHIDTCNREPGTVDELVHAVATFYSQMGGQVQLNAPLRSTAGPAEVDLLVSMGDEDWGQTILVDCNHWNRRVETDLTHTYRAVVAEAGADQAIIFSRYSFHSGALGAVGRSNVRVCTWSEFVRRHHEPWFQAQCADLKTYLDVLLEFRKWPTGDRTSSRALTGQDLAGARSVLDTFEPYLLILTSGVQQTLYHRPCIVDLPGESPDDPSEPVAFEDIAQWHAYWKPRLVQWVEDVCRWREELAEQAPDWACGAEAFDGWA